MSLLTDLQTVSEYETLKDVIVWRCISAHRRFGTWEYLFDDYVLTTHIGEYISLVTRRGTQRISLHNIGPVKDAFVTTKKRPMKGTVSIANERKLSKLEDFQ